LQQLNYFLKIYLQGILNSYAQVFFSNSRVFAVLLLLVSFFDIGGGIGSIVAVVCCQILATLFKYNHEQIRDGSLTYNALMVGTAIGFSFEWNLSILVLIIVASTLTFFVTVWYSVTLGLKRLPYLSIPFLLSIWIVLLGAPNFSLLKLSAKSSLSLFNYFPELFEFTSAWIASIPIANFLHLLFRSTGAIFFQYNDLAGVIILIGILLQSRIAFMLAIYSFSIGYLFYSSLEGNFSQLIYSYIGFNFILTGIALGGFFVVPSWRSFLLVGLVIPINALLISGLHPIFYSFGLPLYSLPFNLVVLLSLVIIGQRYYAGGLIPVSFQEYSPEKHVYKHRRNISRYGRQTGVYLSLPVMGEWSISQAYNGKHTHKGIYAFAFDFDIRDEKGLTYKADGSKLTDYYCYNLPVIAPANGYISDVRDGIKDNEINEVDLEQNWGNALVIKHAEGLYTKLSHLMLDSIQVKLGDFVYKGQLIARCGSSGRSPEPHLHFQVQWLPFIGAGTIKYPFSYFIKKANQKSVLKSFDYPQEGDFVKNILPSKPIADAFSFVPGKKIRAESFWKGKNIEEIWTVHTNAWNQTYFHLENSACYAYFVNDGNCFYFTEYYGNKNTLLYRFFESAYKVILGLYEGVEIKDELLPERYIPIWLAYIQDFVAPFKQFVFVNYTLSYDNVGNLNQNEKISLKSKVEVRIGNTIRKQRNHEINILNGFIESIEFDEGKKAKLLIKCHEDI